MTPVCEKPAARTKTQKKRTEKEDRQVDLTEGVWILMEEKTK